MLAKKMAASELSFQGQVGWSKTRSLSLARLLSGPRSCYLNVFQDVVAAGEAIFFFAAAQFE